MDYSLLCYRSDEGLAGHKESFFPPSFEAFE